MYVAVGSTLSYCTQGGKRRYLFKILATPVVSTVLLQINNNQITYKELAEERPSLDSHLGIIPGEGHFWLTRPGNHAEWGGESQNYPFSGQRDKKTHTHI